jgi:hypothetical protein
VRRWRNRLRRELGISDLDWNEDPETEYMTDKPAWDCYGALVLWAAYDELPSAKRRDTAEGWDKDPAYLTSRVNPRSRYQHLIADTEIWLPWNLRHRCERQQSSEIPWWWGRARNCWQSFES